MDTADKRFSAVNVQSPWRGLGIFPSGAVGQPARYALAHLYSGFEPPADVELTIGDGAVTIGGGSVSENVGLAIGGGSVTLAGQAQSYAVNFGIGGGAVGIAGQSIDLLAELDVALALESGQITIAGQSLGLSVVSQQSSGGWEFLNTYELQIRRRREREIERQKLEEETEQIPDTVDREIAQFMRAQEAIDDRKQELLRLAELAKQNADLEAARRYSERVAQRLEEALKKGTLRSIKQLDYELKRAREDEEAFMLAMLMMLE